MGEVLKFCRQMHHAPIHKPYSGTQLVHHCVNFPLKLPEAEEAEKQNLLFFFFPSPPSIYLLVGEERREEGR